MRRVKVLSVAVAIMLFAGLVSWTAPASTEKVKVFFAGGCYWGVEAVFRHVKGVESAVSGFAVPVTDTVLPGTTPPRHSTYAETVEVEFDPSQVTYEQLLEIFFSVVHDPTELDRQGPDVGPQYRSALFATDTAQAQIADAFLQGLKYSKAFRRPITTRIVMLERFKKAPEAHQNYVAKNPMTAYVRAYDLPKLKHLQEKFPDLYRE